MSVTNDAAVELARFLDSGPTPIYVLDEDRRILFCNTACADWLGVAAENLHGQKCNYHTPADETEDEHLAALAAGLCPPPLAFAGQPVAGVVSCRGQNGRVSHRRGQFIPLAHGEDESAPVVAILDRADCPAESLAAGRPTDDGSLDALHEALRRYRQQQARAASADRLIGEHPQIVRARAQIQLAARGETHVTITGQPGTGKEHAGKAIHYGQTAPGLLAPIDCALMETNLLRSTLRTLVARRTLRPANSTLLVEHAQQMSAEVQGDLLAMLNDGSLGMRVVALCDTPLEEAIAEGLFSTSLACALGTLEIELPALTERIDDLPLLAQAMIEQQNAAGARQLAGFSSEALDQLAAYPWPGNLDELQVLVREMHEKAAGPRVLPRDLPRTIQWGAEATSPPRTDEAVVLEEFLAKVERELIARAMRKAKGNKSRAAKMLGLTRPRLYRRLVQLGLEPDKSKMEPKPDVPE
jgi:transcriptional regulator with PAS, ATPase and Fis domain